MFDNNNICFAFAANFTLPSPDFGWFDEVIYTELNEEDAKKKVQEFNEKGKKALKERERDNDRDRRRGKITPFRSFQPNKK